MLRDGMAAQKMSNRELARQSGVSQSYVTRILAGTRWPSKIIWKKLFDVVYPEPEPDEPDILAVHHAVDFDAL